MSDISTAELDDIYAFAVQLGKDAGDLLMSYARTRWSGTGSAAQQLVEKDSSVDIVTKADEGMPWSGCRLIRRIQAKTPPRC